MPSPSASRCALLATLWLPACSEYKVSATGNGEAGGAVDTGTPALQVSPLAIDFGQLALGDEATETVTITNVGDADLAILGLSLDAAGAYSVTSLNSVLLQADASTSVVVTFAPDWTQAEAFTGTLDVESDAPGDGTASVTLTGTTPIPVLELSPSSHDFGTLDVGDSDSVALTLTNTGGADATVSLAEFYSSSETELTVSSWGGLDAVPLNVAPGDVYTATVEFAPLAAGSVEGAFVVSSDDPENPELYADILGASEGEPPCEGSFDVDLWLTADDAWRGWIDGVEFTGANQNTWSLSDEYSETLPCGDHTVAIYGTDTASVIAGFISVVSIDGIGTIFTGTDSWLMADADPGTGWQDVGFDDSAWSTAVVCADNSAWGTYWPADFYAAGAEWVWWTSQCSDLSQAWFRLDFTLE